MAATRRMTLMEFLAIPEEAPYSEFVNGEIWVKPMPGPLHSSAVVELLRLIANQVHGSRRVRVDTELRHVESEEDRVYLPDISVTLLERFPAEQRRGPIEVHPDFAIEVLSPDDRADRVQNKVQFYLRSGVSVVWVVDPDYETITVYRPDGPPREFRGEETVAAEPVLRGFALTPGAFFAAIAGAA